MTADHATLIALGFTTAGMTELAVGLVWGWGCGDGLVIATAQVLVGGTVIILAWVSRHLRVSWDDDKGRSR